MTFLATARRAAASHADATDSVIATSEEARDALAAVAQAARAHTLTMELMQAAIIGAAVGILLGMAAAGVRLAVQVWTGDER